MNHQPEQSAADLVSAATPPTRWYGASSRDVALFLHRLRGLPASVWLEAARQPCETPGDRGARLRLQNAAAAMPEVMARIRRRVNSDVTVFEHILPEAALERMRGAANTAACALAAQSHLAREEFDDLYQPFARLIPPPRHLSVR